MSTFELPPFDSPTIFHSDISRQMSSPAAVPRIFSDKGFLLSDATQHDFHGFNLDINLKQSQLADNSFTDGQGVSNEFGNLNDGFGQIITQSADAANYSVPSGTCSPHIDTNQLNQPVLIPDHFSHLDFDFNLDALTTANSENSAADNENSSVEHSCNSLPKSERNTNRRVGRAQRSSPNSSTDSCAANDTQSVTDRRKRGRPKKNSLEQTTSSASSTTENSQDDESSCQGQQNAKKLKGIRSVNSIVSLVINNREHRLSKLIAGENDPKNLPAPGPDVSPKVLAVSNQNAVVDELLNSAVTNGKDSVKSAVSDQVISALISEAAIKRVRLARKAELARLSRCKKKSRLNELEEENQRLKIMIDELKQQQLALTEEQIKFKTEGAANTSNTVEDKSSDSVKVTSESVVQSLDECVDRLLDFCKSPASAHLIPLQIKQLFAVQHGNKILLNAAISILNSVRNRILPIYSSFLIWILSRNDYFVNDPAGLWKELWSDYLKISPGQMTKLMELRAKLQKQFQNQTSPLSAKPAKFVNDQSSNDQFSHVVNELVSQQVQSSDNLQFLADLLTPDQLIAYFHWVKQFGHVCIKINTQ